MIGMFPRLGMYHLGRGSQASGRVRPVVSLASGGAIGSRPKVRGSRARLGGL
jgi:hypothetical protein